MFLLELLKIVSLLAAVVIFVGFLAVCVFIRSVHVKYSHLPGPKRRSFFFGNLSELSSAVDEDIPVTLRAFQLQQQYGPVFVLYILHNVIVFAADPATVKEVLMNPVHKKPGMYAQLGSIYGVRFMGKGLVTEIDTEKWSVHRKIFTPAFHRKHLMELTKVFNSSSDRMVTKLKGLSDTGEAVPLMDTLNRVTLDVIAKAGFGMKGEFILEDTSFARYVEMSFLGMLHQTQKPFEFIYPSTWKFRREVQNAVQTLRNTGKELIIKARKAQADGESLDTNILSNIMKYFDLNEGDFDLETLIDEFLTFFVAGQDTTASLLGFAIVEIGKQPEIMKKVRDEIDSVIGDKEYISYDDVMKMEYTLLVLKETLRLYPPAAGTSRETAHDMNVCGYHIPAGTMLQLLHFNMSRMEEFFKNPLTFDPERFLRDEDKPLYAYFPFSSGIRSCIGQQFALIEARIILAKLYRNFDLKLDPRQSFDLADQFTLKPKGKCTNYIYSRERETADQKV